MQHTQDSATGAFRLTGGVTTTDWINGGTATNVGVGFMRVTLDRPINEHEGVFIVSPSTNGTATITHTSDTVKLIQLLRNGLADEMAASFTFIRKPGS